MKKEIFINEIIFNVVGLLSDLIVEEKSFNSISGMCRISLFVNETTGNYANIEIRLLANSMPIGDNITYAKLRQNINRKIGKELENDKIEFRPGTAQPYEAIIKFYKLMDYEAVKYTSKIISKAISAFEQPSG